MLTREVFILLNRTTQAFWLLSFKLQREQQYLGFLINECSEWLKKKEILVVLRTKEIYVIFKSYVVWLYNFLFLQLLIKLGCLSSDATFGTQKV